MKEAKRFYRPGSKRTKEFMLARTMMVLVLVFLILNTPRLILGLVEVNFLRLFILNTFLPLKVTQLTRIETCYEAGLDYYKEKQTYILDFLARFFVVINCSVNFVIYCLVGSQFRTELSTMVDKHCGSGRKVLSYY